MCVVHARMKQRTIGAIYHGVDAAFAAVIHLFGIGSLGLTAAKSSGDHPALAPAAWMSRTFVAAVRRAVLNFPALRALTEIIGC